MSRFVLATAATILAATGAQAAGVERSTQSTGILFEDGNYAEFTIGHVKPKVSGTQRFTVPGTGSVAGASSGNMTGSYTPLSFGVKMQVNDRVDLALVVDQPIGADVNYAAGTGYLYGGSVATIDSVAVTAMGRYSFNRNFSIFGGVRAMQTSGDVALFNGYKMTTSDETDFGYLFGVAYERPDIALRVALTYNSAIKHTFDITENGAPSLPMGVEIPQSVNLEFQSGVAKDTLVFGSIRYVDWTEFNISPAGYVAAAQVPLVKYNDDTVALTLGLGRRFNENWSGAITVGYEDAMGGFSGNLGPTDGQKSIGLGLTYEKDQFKITGGIRYVDLGNTQTEAPRAIAPAGTAFGDFSGNHAVAVGLKVGIKF